MSNAVFRENHQIICVEIAGNPPECNLALAKRRPLLTILAHFLTIDAMIADLILALLAFAPPPAEGGANPQGQTFTSIGMMVIIMVVFWVLLIRPQQKRAKEQALLVKSIKPGDKVGTSSGILGVVVSVKDHTVTIRSADSKLEVTKNSIQERLEERATENSSSTSGPTTS